jgi:Tubulin/FtsZ family, GTPase domain
MLQSSIRRRIGCFDRRSIILTCTTTSKNPLLVALALLLLLASDTNAFGTVSQRKQQQRFARSFLSALSPRGGEGTSNGGKTNAVGLPAPCDIRVIGVGGGGGNAVNHMVENTQLPGVSFTSINTDAQALAKSLASNVVNIGRRTTRGLGAGGDPAIGCKAALESVDELEGLVKGADMVFITAGMVRRSGNSQAVLGVWRVLGAAQANASMADVRLL